MLYLFKDYALDSDRRELRRGADLVPVEPQVFDLLEHLIRNRERVVSKDDLLASVWSGRVVSESALTSRINAARSAIGDSGEAQRLIKTIPRKGIRFVGAVREEQRSAEPSSTAFAAEQPSLTLALPDRPSIAVLPFQNMSGDPEQEYFADGMAEEIITALSRMRWLFVIARNSSFTYKGRAVDVKVVGRNLGVRYVLEGGVRKSANRVRITAQLIDASTGVHLWADRFDGVPDDIFDLQDNVTASVVGAIAPKLEQAEIERAKHKPTGSLDAYDYLLRGLASFYRGTREAMSEGLRLFNKAIELDPNFASAHGLAAWSYLRLKASGWLTDPMKETAEAVRLARRAADLGKEDAVALCTGGFTLAYFDRDFDAGALFIDRALVLNPNLATAWLLSGWLRVLIGEPDTAIKHFAQFKRLSPLDHNMVMAQSGSAFAHLFAGRYDEASSRAELALQESPNRHQALRASAASNALAGRIDQAQKAMARLRQLDPALRVSNLGDLTPLRRPEDMAKYAEGMRKAGLPE